MERYQCYSRLFKVSKLRNDAQQNDIWYKSYYTFLYHTKYESIRVVDPLFPTLQRKKDKKGLSQSQPDFILDQE